MIIEETTAYAYKIKRAVNLTFDNVRAIAKKFIDDLPQDDVNELYDELNHGIDQLTTEPQMLVYLYSFGNMHQAKLNRAFEQLPNAFMQQPEIRIVDYGCGQAIGTMCYAEFLTSCDSNQKVSSITLIEPSETCLKRAALHVSKFFPDAEVRTLRKSFDELSATDINSADDTIVTLHILSNVLDIQNFDLKRLASIIKKQILGYNQFVCVGPYFKYPPKDNRMSQFCKLMNGLKQSFRFYDKYEISPEETWTAQILDFSVGHLANGESITEATDYEIECGIKDEYGVVYSSDGKRLLKCKNWGLKSYDIRNGTNVICTDAFKARKSLQKITIPNSVQNIGEEVFERCNSLEKIIIPQGSTEKFKKMLPEDLWDKLYCLKKAE